MGIAAALIYGGLLYGGFAGLIWLANRNERLRKEALLKESLRLNLHLTNMRRGRR